MDMKRRELLDLGGMTLVGTTLSPASVRAQTPKRGGTISRERSSRRPPRVASIRTVATAAMVGSTFSLIPAQMARGRR